jgi:hypothetical protein
MGCFGITSLRLGFPITGNFGQKFSPSGFAISLTPSNLRRSNARWERFSERNEHETAMRPRIAFNALQISTEFYLHGPGTGITNLPSFSAMKFSVLLVELPLASFFSILMMSFFVGLSVRQT